MPPREDPTKEAARTHCVWNREFVLFMISVSFARTGDSLLADSNVDGTLLVLQSDGRGAYRSMHF
jgi:hypothetical protein